MSFCPETNESVHQLQPKAIDTTKGITYDTKMIQNIVIDTNVLLTALKSSRGASYRLLSLLDEKQYVVHVSTPLVAEYEAVLKRGHLTLSEQQIEDIIDFICAKAVHHEIFYLWRPALKDADDDFLLELAVKAQAMIVTWNLNDFKQAETFGIRVMNPRDFLNFLENPA
jgi:putative PIN family toxin of toxin-antitoxin system